MILKIDVPEVGEVEQTAELSDYHVVDGVKVPFTVHSSSTVQNFTITITKVEHYVKIDPALFSKPATDK